MLPVRPPAAPDPGGSGSDSAPGPAIADDPEEVDMRKALLSEPIVGVDKVLVDENGPGARQPTPLPSPRPMTHAQKVLHDLTHLPYDRGCPICVSTRRPNDHHHRAHEELRVIPFLVADYCFMKFAGDQDLQTVLVMRLYPYKLFFACAVPQKGVHNDVIREIVNFIRDAGLTHFAYRCDMWDLGTLVASDQQ